MPAATATRLDPGYRADKIRKISALLAKTTANGCTAAEAASATALADQLMARYGIAPDELGIQFAHATNGDSAPRRKTQSHADCDHPSTSKARAACRRAGGPSANNPR